MITVFSTVLALVANSTQSATDVLALCEQRPLARLATALELLNIENAEMEFTKLLDKYEEFLAWKERDDIEEYLEFSENKRYMRESSAEVADFMYRLLTSEKIPEEYRRYLVI